MPTNNDTLSLGNKRKLVTDAATGSTPGQTCISQRNSPFLSVQLEGSHEPVNPILNPNYTVKSFPEGTYGLPAENKS